MPSKPFAWTDRDTAARDLMQLVYHGTQDIRRGALEALSGIRSTAIINDLKQIVLSRDWPSWDRIYALRAIAAVPGDIYFPELLAIAAKNFATLESNLQEPTTVDRNDNRTSERSGFSQTLENNDKYLIDIVAFVDKHQSNREWFFDLLNRVDTVGVWRMLKYFLRHRQSEPFKSSLLERLLDLCEKHPQYLDIDTVHDLHNLGDARTRTWLERRLDEIVQMYLSRDIAVTQVPDEWVELKS